MYNTSESRGLLDKSLKLAERLPADIDFTPNNSGGLTFFFGNQEKARLLRCLYPEVTTWQKSRDPNDFWSYSGTMANLMEISISYISGVPPTCKAVAVTKTRTVKKPVGEVQYEDVIEEYTVTEWVCCDEPESEKVI